MPARATEKGFSVYAALAMGRAQQRLGERYQDEQLANRGRLLEARALAAIKDGKSELPPMN
jgi:hypothetical protein